MNTHFLYRNHLLLSLFLVVTSCHGQVKIDPPREIVKQTSIDGDNSKIVLTQGAKSGNIICNIQDKNGNLWFSTSGEGIYLYDPSASLRAGGKSFTNFTTKDGLCSNDVNAIIEDKAGNILVGTKSGICKYDGKFFSNFSETNDASRKPISSLLEDREGNLWFGTWGDGVYCYDFRASLTAGKKIYTNFLNKDESEKNPINFLKKKDYLFNLGETNQLILDIHEDKNGNIWFSSWNGGGVWRYDPSASLRAGTDSFTNYLPSADYYRRNEDGRSGNQINLRTEPAIFTDNSQDNISDDMIFSISEDNAGNLWFATRNHGACRFDPSASIRTGGKAFTSIGPKEGFLSSNAYDILEDKNGNIWFTTEKDGVWCYNPSTSSSAAGNSFKNYTTADGLVNNSVFSVLEDKDGNLWFGTRWYGLSRFNPREKTFTTFSEYKEE